MGTLSYNKHKFLFLPAFNDPDGLAKSFGFKEYEPDPLQWVTRSAAKAVKLRRFADESAERKFKKTFITDLAPPERIIYPDHLEPYVHQIESAWHALTRTPAYIADEAGLGKTAAAIMAINSDPGLTVVVCPPYLQYNWHDEFKRWSLGRGQYSIIPDSQLSDKKYANHLKAMPGKLKWLIVDEAHRYKTGDTQRTNALLGDEDGTIEGLTAAAERTILLSGTPFPNGRPIELYPVLSRLAPESILHRNAEAYWKTFCGGKSITRYEGRRAIVSRDLQGASNLKQLKRELQTKFMIRHLKKDCLKELPSKTRKLIFLDTPDTILQFEKKHFQNLSLVEIQTHPQYATYRKQVGVSKIEQSLEVIKDVLDTNPGKLVVAAVHIDVVENLSAGLLSYGALKIRGGMTAIGKKVAVDCFQNSKNDRRVLVGNIASMGLGNTLTAACRMIIVEPDPTPGVMDQLEDRIHRITQTERTDFWYIVLRNSLDERVLRQGLFKEENMHSLMN